MGYAIRREEAVGAAKGVNIGRLGHESIFDTAGPSTECTSHIVNTNPDPVIEVRRSCSPQNVDKDHPS